MGKRTNSKIKHLSIKYLLMTNIFVFLVGIAFTGCQMTSEPFTSGASNISQQDFNQALREVAENSPDASLVTLSDVTEFDWDRVCLFPQGAKHGDINQMLEIDFYRNIERRVWDDNQVLVFVKEGQVVFVTSIGTIMYSDRQLQYWSMEGMCLSSIDAIFTVYKYHEKYQEHEFISSFLLLPNNYQDLQRQ